MICARCDAPVTGGFCECPGEPRAPSAFQARVGSIARRWAKDSKPCDRCGTPVLWRQEITAGRPRRVAIDEKARLHACE